MTSPARWQLSAPSAQPFNRTTGHELLQFPLLKGWGRQAVSGAFPGAAGMALAERRAYSEPFAENAR